MDKKQQDAMLLMESFHDLKNVHARIEWIMSGESVKYSARDFLRGVNVRINSIMLMFKQRLGGEALKTYIEDVEKADSGAYDNVKYKMLLMDDRRRDLMEAYAMTLLQQMELEKKSIK